MSYLVQALKKQPWMEAIAVAAIALTIYAITLALGFPDVLNFRSTGTVIPVILVFVLVLYPVYRLAGWQGSLISLSLTLFLFALPLSGIWQSGDSSGYLIGGLLQWTDARGYHWEAQRLLEGYRFSPFASRRPMFAAFLAGLLWLSGRNMQIALAALVALNGVASFFLVRELQRHWGTLASLLGLCIVFLFYRTFIGTTMTENLGLALGSLALAALLRCLYFRQNYWVYLGIFLLSSSLNARAGAFFILPAIVVWGIFVYQEKRREFLVGSISAVILAFLCNFILLKIVGATGEVGFSNFSYVLYGIIHQGDWTTVYQDYPELRMLPEPIKSQRVYELAMESFWDDPTALVSGAFRAWHRFIFQHYIFSFISDRRVNKTLEILSLFGFITCCFRFRQPVNSLILFCWLGILASVPFVPPWDADSMRAYGATIPVIAILPIIGFQTVTYFVSFGRFKKFDIALSKSSKLFHIAYTQAFAGFIAILLALVFVLPIFLKLVSRPLTFPPIACSADSEGFYFRPEAGSLIKVVSDPDKSTSRSAIRLPNIPVTTFRAGLKNFPRPEANVTLNDLEPPATIIHSLKIPATPAISPGTDGVMSVWLLLGEDFTPTYGEYYSVCATPLAAGYNMYRADSFVKSALIKN